MNSTKLARQILETEEGYEGNAYLDTEGYWTVGIGKKISPKNAPSQYFSNFPYVPQDVARLWMESDVMVIQRQLQGSLLFFDRLNAVRRATLISMAYQIGISGFLKFRNTIQLLEDDNYVGASLEMLDSKWADQTMFRADRHANMINTGVLNNYYGGDKYELNRKTYRTR